MNEPIKSNEKLTRGKNKVFEGGSLDACLIINDYTKGSRLQSRKKKKVDQINKFLERKLYSVLGIIERLNLYEKIILTGARSSALFIKFK